MRLAGLESEGTACHQAGDSGPHCAASQVTVWTSTYRVTATMSCWCPPCSQLAQPHSTRSCPVTPIRATLDRGGGLGPGPPWLLAAQPTHRGLRRRRDSVSLSGAFHAGGQRKSFLDVCCPRGPLLQFLRPRSKFPQNRVAKTKPRTSSWFLWLRLETGHCGDSWSLLCAVWDLRWKTWRLESPEVSGGRCPLPVGASALSTLASARLPQLPQAWWLDATGGHGGGEATFLVMTYPQKSRGVMSLTSCLLSQGKGDLQLLVGKWQSSGGIDGTRSIAVAIVGKNRICHSHCARWRSETALGPGIPSALLVDALRGSRVDGAQGLRSTGSGAQVHGFKSWLNHLVA